MTPEATTHSFDPTILREYDIRGRLGETLTEHDALMLGRAFGTMVKRRGGHKVAIGYDGRETSPHFADKLSEGIVSTGLHAELIGLCPSPMLYYTVKEYGADAGVMVTGSHNPPEYNGFKMLFKDGLVYGPLVQELGDIAAKGDFEQGQGHKTQIDVASSYVARLVKDLDCEKDFKIAWDNGNGAGGNVLKDMVEHLPGEHIILFDEVDGTFPNHHPDPTVDANLADLIDVVKHENCDFGIAFDGDADRIGVVDEKGNILRCDILMAVYAASVLSEFPNSAIVADIKCSQVLFDEIERHGGKPVMWKTGHSLIKSKMAEVKAPLAGELSGHIFFADKYYGFDDALYCAIRLINIIAESGKSLSELSSHLPVLYSTPEIRIEVDEAEKFSKIDQLVSALKTQENDSFQVNDIDGARVTTDDGWFLIRASNTQNAWATRVEANSEDGLERLKSMLKKEIENLGYSIQF